MCILQGGISGISAEDLFPPQAELLALGFPGSSPHWLINAPTGGGKTRIAEEAILHAAAEGRIGVYLAPLRAILAERAADWVVRLAGLRPLLLSADIRSGKVKPSNDQLLILTTPEKFNSLLLRWKQHQPWIARVGCLVIDEVHTLGDPGRGATLEALVGRFQRLNPFARIVGLTGTLSNDTEVAHWLHATGYSTDWRPVPLTRATRDMEDPFGSDQPSAENIPRSPVGAPSPSVWPSGVDPYRLRRALDLQVDHLGVEVVRVSGGAEPHSVTIQCDAWRRRSYSCDCADFGKGTLRCKHILRAQFETNDAPDLLDALRALKPDATRPLRFSLGELWMQSGGIYDAFEGKNPDYSGARFLNRALSTTKPR